MVIARSNLAALQACGFGLGGGERADGAVVVVVGLVQRVVGSGLSGR